MSTTRPRGAKAVDCPICGAPAGEPCRSSTYTGRPLHAVQSHYRRVELAREKKALGAGQ